MLCISFDEDFTEERGGYLTRMKIGIGLPATLSNVSGDLLLDWAREADAGPFSSLAVIDRLVYHNFDAFTTLAVVAGATSRIRLMTSVLLAPLYPAALLAKQLASLDALSHGRLTVGMAVGAREDDFIAIATPFHHRGKRFDAQLEIMQRLWSGQPLNENIGPIGPQPVQRAGPEIILGGVSPAAIRRVGRWGNGFLAGVAGPERADKDFRMAENAWKEAGRAGKPRLLGCSYVAFNQAAFERTRDSILHYYAFAGPLAQMIIGNVPVGVRAIQDTIKRYQQIGTDELLFFTGTPELDQVKRLADLIGGESHPSNFEMVQAER
jgi:alkanesulfonate monooxygenase SsuD/methylene tetrahydromethanopterin reductase-like flavin-dependent oxidoreductase (luciferase family)